MSVTLLADIEAAIGTPGPDPTFATLHAEQIARFTRTAGLKSPTAPTTSTPLTAKTLLDRERALARSFRGLALQSQRGDVAALLASAAAGIDQALVR